MRLPKIAEGIKGDDFLVRAFQVLVSALVAWLLVWMLWPLPGVLMEHPLAGGLVMLGLVVWPLVTFLTFVIERHWKR